MIKMIITDAVVSKGFDGNPAIRFYDGDNGRSSGCQIANFRIGKRIYDSREENNYRWINLSVKGFGDICERIKKMKLKEGSFINLVARYDEESWDDKTTGEKRTAPVLILDEIEYCFAGGNNQKNGQNSTGGSSAGTGAPPAGTPQGQPYPPTPQGGPYPPIPQGMPYSGSPYEQGGTPPQAGIPASAPPMPGNFTGFENFGSPQEQFF